MTRSRKVTIGVIFVLAFITGFGAIASTWVKRQVFDNSNWTDTSRKLIANKEIQTALGTYLVNSLYNQAAVQSSLKSVLPKRAQALAGPASAGLQQVALDLTPRVLARPRVQNAWVKANQVAHAQLVKIINGGGNTVSTKNGEVTLNLRPLVNDLAAEAGIQSQVAAARQKLNSSPGAKGTIQQKTGLNLSGGSGQIVIMRSSQLQTAQDIAHGVKSLAIVFTIVSFGLFATAVAIAQDYRRVVFRGVGWALLGLGVLALLVRRVGGNEVVNSLVNIETNKPAAHAVWNISTSDLYSIGTSLVVYGALVVAAAWLVGPQRWAITVRRRLAPALADRLGTVYGTAAVLYLLVLLWGPTPAFRNIIPIVLIAGLIVLGIEVLRHQTAREFPEAHEPPERPPPSAPRAPAALAGH
jgi:hypothetical protein